MSNEVAKQESKKTIFDVIKGGEKQFAAALPKHINSERFTRIAITTIRQNPDLAKCSQESLLGSLMVLAQLGLEPGVLGQAYLLPFKNKKLDTTECQLQISYKGMIELLRRTGQLTDIYAYPVYQNDLFEIEYGLQRTLTHKPNMKEERGELLGIYSVAILKDGTRAFEYMTKKELEEHEQKYRLGQFKNNIWVKNFIEMGSKTVVKKMLKWLPISVEALEVIEKENFVQKYNEETGEVKEEKIVSEEPQKIESIIDKIDVDTVEEIFEIGK